MTTLVVPKALQPFNPSLGKQVCEFIEERCVFGPGSLQEQPAQLDPEKRGLIYRFYEVHPKGHRLEGNRVFDRCVMEVRKGVGKTEVAAWIAFCELHPEAPVRFNGFDKDGNLLPGRPVRSPYIPMLATAEEQVQELAFGVLKFIVEHSKDAWMFDCTLEKIVRLGNGRSNDGMVVPVSNSPSTRDGARTTFQHFDEPLALTTLVPTPQGWSKIGLIRPGDYVYDRHGKEVLVTAISSIHRDRECFKVTFIDGASVVTDGSHCWKAIDQSNRPRGEQVVTTRQMYMRGTDTSHGKRWKLPRSNGYDGVAQELPIDPYLAGMWLGDGATNAGYIHSSPDDYKHIVGDYVHTVSNDARQDVIRWLPTGLKAKLRSCGMLGWKHIPDVYRFSSREQRKALLAGLIDSDGYVIPATGSVTFVQGREELARDVHELVLSLGWDSSLTQRADVRSSTETMWKVQFFANELIPTRLERKRVPGVAKQHPRWPTIASIEPVASVPVRCITVDSDDHLFVFGRESRLTHNSHHLVLPRERKAVETMLQNMHKRQLESPWTLYTSTAGQPGLNSVEEDVRTEAEHIAEGKAENSSMFFFGRWAGDTHVDLSTVEKRIEAIEEATGPVGEWGKGQFERIARDYDRVGIDRMYWERVYLNRWRKSGAGAYNMEKVRQLAKVVEPHRGIAKDAFVTVGFDGARYKDATAIVITEISTGYQQIAGLWERPEDAVDWECDLQDVNGVMEQVFKDYEVWRAYCDPPYYVEAVAVWAGKWPEQVVEWWTNRQRQAAYMARAYAEAIDGEQIKFVGTEDNRADMVRHISHAGRKDLKITDDEGQPLWHLCKLDGQQHNKFDACMAGNLSWQARLDAVADGAQSRRGGMPRRLY